MSAKSGVTAAVEEGGPPPRRLRGVASYLAAALVVVAAYANSVDNPFHFDDAHVIENNLYVRSLENLPRFFKDSSTFSSLPSNQSYRPLVTATLAFDHALAGGLTVRQFHYTQIGLLLVLGGLLTRLYTALLSSAVPDMSPRTPLFGALLFCLHTANTETMNTISARSELLAAIGVVAAFLVFMAAPRLRVYGLHLIPMALGALGKVSAVMYAPLLFVHIWLSTPPDRKVRERLYQALSATWMSFLVCGLTFAFVRSMETNWSSGSAERWPYALTQPFAWLHYARLFFLPLGLTADSDWQVVPAWYDTRALVGGLFVLGLLGLILMASRRVITAPIAFGLAWFAIALVPTSTIFPFAEVINEHRLFFPFMGLTLAAVWAGDLLARWAANVYPLMQPWRLLRIAAIGLLGAHGVGTWERNRAWSSTEALWRDVSEKSPRNGRGLMNYGVTLMARGDLLAALDYFKRAQALLPGYGTLEANMGVVYGALNQPDEAESHFRRALELTGDGDNYYLYAMWLRGVQRGDEALAVLQLALGKSPGRLDIRHALVRLSAANDDNAALNALVQETLELVPGDAVALAYARRGLPGGAGLVPGAAMQAGLTALAEKRLEDAAESFFQCAVMDPTSADAWNNRGWAQYELGLYDAAARTFERALQLDPRHERARNNLALAHQRR